MTIRNIIRRNIKSLTLLFLTFVTFLISVWINSGINSISDRDVEIIEKSVHKKQLDLENIIIGGFEECAPGMLPSFDTIWPNDVLKKGLSLYILDSSNIVYWSENLYTNFDELSNICETKFIQIGNSWYVANPYSFGKYTAIGLLLINTEYSYQNKYLKNGPNPNLKFPQNSFVMETSSVLGTAIRGFDGDELFKVSINTTSKKEDNIGNYFSWLTLFLLLAFIVVYFYNCRIQLTPLVFLILLGIRVIVAFSGDSTHNMFSPMVYADSALLPSLGDLALHTLFLLAFFIVLTSSINNRYNGCTHKRGRYILYSVIVGLFALAVHYVIYSLIINSNIAFNVNTLEWPNVIFYLLASFVIASLFALFYQTIHLQFKFFNTVTKKCKFVQAGIITLIFIVASCYDIYFLLGIITAIVTLIAHKFKKLNFTLLIIVSVIFSIYLSIAILLYSNQKTKSERDAIAKSMIIDRDPITEFLLKSVEANIAVDEKIQADLFKNEFIKNKLIKHIKENYFQGYFLRYSVSVDICSSNSLLYLSGKGKAVRCGEYYTEELLNSGESIAMNSCFYHMNDNSSSYLGAIPFVDSLQNNAYLYIRLQNKENVNIIGYPDLLVASDNNIQLKRDDFLTAKYSNNKLFLGSDVYDFESELNVNYFENNMYKVDGYNFYLYPMENDVCFVVGNHSLSFVEVASIFSHSFLFVILSFLVFLAGVIEFDIDFKRLSYRWRVYIVVIGSFTIMLTLMAVFILIYSMNKAEERHNYNIHERMKAVLISFDKIGLDVLWGDTKRKKTFDDQIIDLSNSFHTDINVYGLKGNLISTSRPEIFQKKLIGTYINRKAFTALVNGKLSKYINNEKIGDLTYHSVYAKYSNSLGEQVGYINLPYFVRESDLSREMTSLLETILNIYILLAVMGFIISTFIVNKITRPLNDVRQKMEKLDILGQPEPIVYRRNDELGDLIKEYNRMVLELAESAKKLAISEREAAWGEMARQIAHEIKNPLTPMKLGLQHVMRMKKDNKEGWQNKLEDVAKSILEQIDVLSETASEFSSFAKLNKQKLSTVELGRCLDASIKLFQNYHDVEFIIKGKEEEHYVSANQEQLIRVFTNLIKNGIEAPNKNKLKKIQITVKEFVSEFYVIVKDNGEGIKTEQERYLFRPNFTTKSRGTGLGLAISKSIMESFEGSISYISEKGGACFEVRIAKISNEEMDSCALPLDFIKG